MDEVGRDIERTFWTSMALLLFAAGAALFGTLKALGWMRHREVVH